MTKCIEQGCRRLKTICDDCGRIVITADFSNSYGFINLKEQPPERHETMLLGWDGEQFIPYDKIDRKEMKSTCKGTPLTHWLPMPEAPHVEKK